MPSITQEDLSLLAPNARSSYRQAFQEANGVLTEYGIDSSNCRVCHFLAQVLHETGGLTILQENLNYTAKRLCQVWPKRFPTVADAEEFAHNPRRLANKVYGGRMGNVNPDDGWRYIGRGMLQITGRESYERIGDALGIDLVGSPELAIDPQWSLPIACQEWRTSQCNECADADDIRRVTKKINGGYIGLKDREDWLAKARKVWPYP